MPGTAATLDGIVEGQAAVVLAGVEALRRDLPDAVHDARVSVRKLRSTLVVFRPVLRRTSAVATDLRWFAGELSQARDAQVVRERVMAGLGSADAPADQRAELLAELDRTAAPAWLRAEQALHDPRLPILVGRLDEIREHGLARRRASNDALAARADAALHELLATATTCASVPPGPSDDERIHDLRKQVKRVRFAVATCRDSLGPATPAVTGLGRVAHVLADLQDVLGEYQDAVVTAGVLDEVAASLSDGADGSTLASSMALRQRDAAAVALGRLPAEVDRLGAAVRALQP